MENRYLNYILVPREGHVTLIIGPICLCLFSSFRGGFIQANNIIMYCYSLWKPLHYLNINKKVMRLNANSKNWVSSLTVDVDYLEGGPEDHDVPGWLYPGLAVYLDWDLRVDVYLDMTALHYPDGGPQAALDLSEMDDTLHSNYLQHPVPVVGLGELLVLLRSPDVGPGAPAHDVEDDDPLYRWQLYMFTVHLQFDFLVKIFTISPSIKYFPHADFDINTCRERKKYNF